MRFVDDNQHLVFECPAFDNKRDFRRLRSICSLQMSGVSGLNSGLDPSAATVGSGKRVTCRLCMSCTFCAPHVWTTSMIHPVRAMFGFRLPHLRWQATMPVQQPGSSAAEHCSPMASHSHRQLAASRCICLKYRQCHYHAQGVDYKCRQKHHCESGHRLSSMPNGRLHQEQACSRITDRRVS